MDVRSNVEIGTRYHAKFSRIPDVCVVSATHTKCSIIRRITSWSGGCYAEEAIEILLGSIYRDLCLGMVPGMSRSTCQVICG